MLQTYRLIPIHDSVYIVSPTLFIEWKSTGGQVGLRLRCLQQNHLRQDGGHLGYDIRASDMRFGPWPDT